MTKEDLPLFNKQGQTWQAKQFALSSLTGQLVRSRCSTQEAQRRFLNIQQNAAVLSSHARKTAWNPQIPYRYHEPDGEWLFYFAGKGKTDKGRTANLWNVYFLARNQRDSLA